MRRSLVSLLGVILFGAAGVATAQQGSGSVTIDGKTIALPYARAWAAGHMMQMPFVEVMLSEKPLKDLQWWASGTAFAEGKQGIVLRLKPNLSMESKPTDAKIQYLFEEDYQVTLFAPGFADWSGYPLSKEGLAVTDFSATKGTVHGQVAWSGSVESTSYTDDPPKTTTVTAWSATFNLPLEEVGPQPK